MGNYSDPLTYKPVNSDYVPILTGQTGQNIKKLVSFLESIVQYYLIHYYLIKLILLDKKMFLVNPTRSLTFDLLPDLQVSGVAFDSYYSPPTSEDESEMQYIELAQLFRYSNKHDFEPVYVRMA